MGLRQQPISASAIISQAILKADHTDAAYSAFVTGQAIRLIAAFTAAIMLTFGAIAFANDEADAEHAYAPYGTPLHEAAFTSFLSADVNAPKACTIKLSAHGAFNTLNPWIAKGRRASGVYEYLYDGLLEESSDERQVGYGLIAQSVEVSDDGRSAVFHINPKARFHDGKPILSDDVAYTVQIFRKDARPFWRLLLKDAEITAIDDHTVRARFPENADRAALLHFGAMPVLPKHYWETRAFGETTMEPPLGSGPYRIAEVDPGRRIVFERVRDYWASNLPVRKGAHNFDRLVYDHFYDETTQLAAFMKSDIDRLKVTERQWAEATRKPGVQSGKIDLVRLDAWWPMGMNGFFFNLKNDLFTDVRVREALGMATPFEWVNARLLHSAYSRTQSYFENAPFSAVAPPNATEREAMAAFPEHFPEQAMTRAYAPEDANLPEGGRRQLMKARTLLESAGWRINPKTKLMTRKEDGRILDFTIIAQSDSQRKLFGAWARQLEKLGVRARLQVIDSAAYQDRMASGDFDVAYRFYIPSERPGAEQIRLWGGPALNPDTNGNRFGIDSPAVNHFLLKLQAAKTEVERTFALRLLDRALQWGHYAVPAYQDKQWRFAYWSERIKPPARSPAQGDGMEFWQCANPD